jgi:eukaryotic-like serine/threonine-protein kinase
VSDPDETKQDQLFGEYRLIQKLGGGSFSSVYLAEHTHEHSQVALKILQVPLNKREDFRDFLNEARTIRLRHPHIIPLLDFGLSRQDFPFLVMEYASGGTLRDRHPKGSQLPLSTIAEYVDQIASALQYAHDHRIIHRDVKPANMLLRADGTLLLSDFGIAKITESSTLMSIQPQIGTPAYMAPEQYQGNPCFASDQYALAVVAYEWISGTCPFQGSEEWLAVQHINAAPPSLQNFVPSLPPAVEQVIMKALAKVPEERFATVQEFAAALRLAVQQAAQQETDSQARTQEHPSSAEDGSMQIKPSSHQTRRKPRKKLLILGILLLVAIIITALVINTVYIKRETPLNANTVSRLVKKWTFHTGNRVYSSPKVVDGVVYVGSSDKNMYAIDARSGQKKWTFLTDGAVSSSPEVVDGVVYVGSDDKNVYALDAQSGRKKWAFPTGGNVSSSPKVVNGIVYVGSGDKNMYAIDAQSGQTKWIFPTGDAVYSAPKVKDGVVYTGSWDFNVYALDARSGQKKWSFPTKNYVDSSPEVVDGVVYIGSWDFNVYALDAKSGKQKWAFQTKELVSSSPAVVDGVVYIGSEDGNVYALDARSGQQKWAFFTGFKVDLSITARDGVVYASSEDGNLYALDAQSGQKKWAFPKGGSMWSSPAVVNNVVYVGSEDGNVHAFGLPENP